MAYRNYNVQCNGVTIVTTVTNSSSLIDSVLNEFRSKRIIALRIKCNPNSANKKVATLQLCHGNRCIIIQLLHLDSIPNSLINLLLDRSIKFVGMIITQDIAKLDRDYGLKCWSGHELGSLMSIHAMITQQFPGRAAGREMTAPSVEELISMFTHHSDWSTDILTSEQIKAATIDAYTSFSFGNMLLP
ncbi:uncharacterized protein LOC113271887 [Papaver somniferum]|uniref:uncharacterized protein LOC113271887 n=1 Tax=Papaver somniferum TaxID=3469 RepID=UPI000E6F7862|nr:uncharacterized protein LOC113271887 [Papaver somniferum]